MFPIREHNNGIGYSFKDFSTRFIEICNDHIENDRAKAFAFIFWDFKNELCVDEFAQLDRLSDKTLSIFYLDSNNKRLFNRFNRLFLRKLGFGSDGKNPSYAFPFIVFFKITNNKITDSNCVELRKDAINSSFSELKLYIKDYVNEEDNNSRKYKNIKIYSKKIAGGLALELVMKSLSLFLTG